MFTCKGQWYTQATGISIIILTFILLIGLMIYDFGLKDAMFVLLFGILIPLLIAFGMYLIHE